VRGVVSVGFRAGDWVGSKRSQARKRRCLRRTPVLRAPLPNGGCSKENSTSGISTNGRVWDLFLTSIRNLSGAFVDAKRERRRACRRKTDLRSDRYEFRLQTGLMHTNLSADGKRFCRRARICRLRPSCRLADFCGSGDFVDSPTFCGLGPFCRPGPGVPDLL
jgi:hypothetical protein